MYGEAVNAAPRFTPSSWNCTLATPTLSEAFAVTVTVFETVAPFAGTTTDTVGRVVSGVVLFTVTVTTPLVAVFPAPSFAIALTVWELLLVFVVSHE